MKPSSLSTRSFILFATIFSAWPSIVAAAPPPAAGTPPAGGVEQKPLGDTPAAAGPATPNPGPAPTEAATPPVAVEREDEESRRKDKRDKKGGPESEQAPGAAGSDDFPGAGDPWGSSAGAFGALKLTFRFLIQTRYRHSFGVDSANTDEFYRVAENTLARNGDGWDLNRAFFGVTAEPSKYLGVKLVLDAAELRHDKIKKVVKQFYADLRPFPKHLHIVAGIMKVPYSIQELDSSSRYEFADSGEANALVSDLGFGGRDIGAQVIVSPLSKPRYLRLTAGLFRAHANDEIASPIGLIAGRIESTPVKSLRLGASVVSQPRTVVELNPLETSGKDLLPNPDDPAYPRSRTWEKGNAFGLDVTFQHKGLMLRGEGLMGDRVDYDFRYGAESWGSAWAIAAYRFGAGPIQLEPALRVEFLDTDLDRESGLYRQISCALGTHFSPSTKLVLDVTRTDVEDGSPIVDQPLPLREIPFNDLSSTRVTAQLQVAL
jgi:hypothetical protein